MVADSVRYNPCYVHPELYRGVLISNPNMMFVSTYASHVPLMACEVYAWLLAGYATGWVEMPTPDEMRNLNETHALAMFELPYFRKSSNCPNQSRSSHISKGTYV